MYFAYYAVDAGAHVTLDLKQLAQRIQVYQLGPAREVLGIVPLDDRVLQLTDAVGVAEYFQHAVSDLPHLAVEAVGEYRVRGRVR